eukprot:scaffold8288_cov129-Cylindrotheca_fusiformis.AAC.6
MTTFRSARLKTRQTPYHRSPENDMTSSNRTTTRDNEEPIMMADSLAMTTGSTSRSGSIMMRHNIYYSWLAGSLLGVGNGLLRPQSAAESSASMTNGTRKALLTPNAMLNMLVPGFFAFETHHVVSNALFHVVKQEAPPFIISSDIGERNLVSNHLLHFVAGATGGLSYGFVEAGISLKGSPTNIVWSSRILGYGALFGGFDCFTDLFGHYLDVTAASKKKDSSDDNGNLWIRQALTVSVAGGFAGMTQALVSNVTEGLATAPKLFSFATSTRGLVRAFFPGAAAFSAYEYARYSFR